LGDSPCTIIKKREFFYYFCLNIHNIANTLNTLNTLNTHNIINITNSTTMQIAKKYNTLTINLLLSLVTCLVINFSYLLAMREADYRDFRTARWSSEDNSTPHTGTLHISKDGYGYITTDSDSIYVVSRLVRRLSLQNGSTLTVTVREPQIAGGNRLMWQVLTIDGVPFDYGSLYDNPGDKVVMMIQLAFYIFFTFVLLTVMTAGAARNLSMRFYLTRAIYCLVIAVALWLLLPVTRPRSGELIVTMMNLPRIYPIDVMKCSFALVLALLYGRTYQLIHQREGIMLENEQLKSENLRARYNTLVNQINPHFLFNSLNSLSALVREGKSDDAVTYIDRLSDTFRYTIRYEPNGTATLGEELEFVDAYKYLLEVRYAGKLFIDIDIDPEKSGWKLPTFSIQPLVENAVKHNSITRARPLRISIRTEGDRLVVSNPINPKIEAEKGTGIGLANLAHRWQLLTGQNIEITDDGKTFAVALPFIKNAE
jgi:hypothetical protein